MSNILLTALCLLPTTTADGPYFASGIKVGEATQDSAIVWVRLTAEPEARFGKLKILTEGLPTNERSKLAMPVDVVPGQAGLVRVRYHVDYDESDERTTPWMNVTDETDFVHQFKLKGLEAGARYRYAVEAKSGKTSAVSASARGRFQTAAKATEATPTRFIVSTCQAVRSIDSGKEGHKAYVQMLKFKPDFFVHTGDILYYDKVPLCRNVAQARAKWNLMFAYGHNGNFHRQVTSYFMKDDHDTLKNDCWPGQKYGDLTFDQGLQIFREQVCMGERTYRTVRWGRDVQIWMTENRDFRSSNRMEDGPEKTILGATQKAWLRKTLRESNARWKFVISPGPIVGPDKRGKKDNHSNENFSHEGNELRKLLSSLPRTFVICGDRHWQYCSRDPKTGLIEMGCGPVNDEHSFGGNPGNNPAFHRYFGSRGGFLGITIDGDNAKAEWFSANANKANSNVPEVLHTEVLGALDSK